VSAIPRERLEKTLARVAREQGLDQERLRRWVSFLALCGVLERALQEGTLTRYYLKGGVAMELRFAGAARATKDLDLALEGDRDRRMAALTTALGRGFDDFTFRVKSQVRQMEIADTVRLQVAVQYRTRNWQTVEVDLGPAEAVEVDLVAPAIKGLVEMGLAVTSPVRCLGISEQVAQKLHACTAPALTGRARDVLDILLVEMLGKLDPAKVRAAAELIFARRGTHTFPPRSELPPMWAPELETLSKELGFPLVSASEIQQKFRSVLEMIATATAN